MAVNYLELVTQLDEMEKEVTDWEANFLEGIMKSFVKEGRMLTDRQMEVLRRMRDRYLWVSD